MVTRDLAQKLGKLAAEFDKDRRLEPDTAPSADTVADFLIRCLFTVYAEDVGLLPEKSFTNLLMEIKEDPRQVSDSLTALWREMNEGGYSATLRRRIPRFNGRVFANATAIPINTTRMDRFIEAARCDWSDVDPSIFGSPLEENDAQSSQNSQESFSADNLGWPCPKSEATEKIEYASPVFSMRMGGYFLIETTPPKLNKPLFTP